MKFEIVFYDPSTGATSPIDTIEAQEGYTGEQYIADCEQYADDEWIEMLKSGTVSALPIE